jgi:Type VI secretion system effector, Hcp
MCSQQSRDYAVMDRAQIHVLETRSLSVRFPGAFLVRRHHRAVLLAGNQFLHLFKIAKDFDRCSPLLFRAGVLQQRFGRVTISFVRPGVDPILFFEIELTNAGVQDLILGANDALGQTAEEVSFTFQTIKLTDIIIGADGTPAGQVVVECDFATSRCR